MYGTIINQSINLLKH